MAADKSEKVEMAAFMKDVKVLNKGSEIITLCNTKIFILGPALQSMGAPKAIRGSNSEIDMLVRNY